MVLDGGLSLAIPTKFGQSLKVTAFDEPRIIWKSLDYQDNIWFEGSFSFQEIATGLPNLRNDLKGRLLDIIHAAKKLNPKFLNSGCLVETKLTFPQNWGLGSSSTLINNIAHWAQVDAYDLLEQTFGGSGYDIACANYNTPITYQIGSNKQRDIKEVAFNTSFKDALYFVYLNKKQNSRDGIAQYRANKIDKTKTVKEISIITSKLITCSKISEFDLLINEHEHIIASIINQTPIKEKLFSDFNGSVKSLGAWGGDFVLVTSKNNPKDYFSSKGYETIIRYSEMIK